ncbi:MAG: LysM peptidoglycan-binding domain-containing protein [Saprospiraceae bacterium]|jgi:nucleoid-associated protein YgaU|nr:LysM peptidoglycan-binding domain-containing protein [Saprospiraceae bacterium]
MSVKAKYQSVLDLGENLNVTDGRVEEAGGKLNVWGTVETQYEKDQLWDAIKAVGGDNPSDIMADIKVANTAYYTKHTVEKGESLSKIAQHYYKDMMKYKAIFEANRDILDNPDLIHPGQVLTIPNL